jgi:hypothetical protein
LRDGEKRRKGEKEKRRKGEGEKRIKSAINLLQSEII